MGATNDTWIMYMLLQIYSGLLKDNPEAAKMPFGDEKPLKLTKENLYLYDYVYTKLNETKVINAIKHVQNGALGFQKYYLASFGDPTHNKKEVMEELQQEFGLSRSDALSMISLILWAHDSGYLKACKSFISMHNKGKVEEDPEVVEKFEDIIKYTFVGDLFSEFYSIHKELESAEKEIFSSAKSPVEEDLVLSFI